MVGDGDCALVYPWQPYVDAISSDASYDVQATRVFLQTTEQSEIWSGWRSPGVVAANHLLVNGTRGPTAAP